MENPESKMVCPKCDIEMNHHADKLIDSRRDHESDRIDPALGGWIEETHQCPGCGAVAGRILEWPKRSFTN